MIGQGGKPMSPFGLGGFGMGITVFYILFFLVAAIIVVQLVRSLIGWQRNNHSPILSVPARIVSKRTEVFHHHTQNGAGNSSTKYYVTFEVESGDRMELSLSGKEYGMLAEGDLGKLTFQGTRYLEFERG